jgi:hypothetical protein
LSNFARGYDKYARVYSKAGIPESKFPDRFFLLRDDELDIGIDKARRLLAKLDLPGNRMLALRTRLASDQLKPNLSNGLGRFVESPAIHVDGVAFVEADASGGRLQPVSVEEVGALSLQLLAPELYEYPRIQPRSFSILPIARGCQASCPFCFSEASASAEQEQGQLDLMRVRSFATTARERGAERFVITGGGEPGLVRHELLCEAIATGRETLGKSVLITNGHHLARRAPAALGTALADYARAGLGVLAISRHHHNEDTSERLMNLRSDIGGVARVWRTGRAGWPNMRLRFTCVLQRGGVDDMMALESYLDWAVGLGVPEICFKELYVSTSVESVYHRHSANEWSHANQVPLALILEFAARHDFAEVARLPWGAPVFRGRWRGAPLQIAAYTEPSLFWERTHGIARSWNLMSDGRCLVSLEDRASEISLNAPA